ncbi:hypothetical protein NEUTE2DRAFT_128577 [Neurospora tetrasperma FGSC 2509]|nr:hypothetical protein NEUTE2DRAFT_128577 [Neurospora tetrasperma FGSC 2509]
MEDAAYSLPVGGHVQGHYSNPLFPSALVERFDMKLFCANLQVHLGRNLNFGRTQQLGANPLRTTKRHGMLGILLPKFDISWWWRSEPNNDRFEIRSGNPRPISPSVAEACVQRDWTSVYDTADNTVAV